ncbi:MAG: hypothetical protein K2L56_02750, partial [Prevotella sp.]|nr:hypothetical protein [Prevotella sp.]
VLMLSIITLAANAVNFTINVDDPERVKVSVAYEEKSIVAGDNVFDVAEYSQVAIEAKAGALIQSIVRTSDGGSEYITNMTSCNLYVSSYNEGETWTVTSGMEADVRTGVCRVTVDDASKVRIQRNGTNSAVTLNDGLNEVRYIPGTETQLMIASSNYGTSLYKVTHNGNTLEAQYNTWYVNLTGDDEVEILANFPDINVPVHFVYADDESKGFITGVTVDATQVDNYNDEDFSVKAGTSITISGNTTDYALDELTINGAPVTYFYGSYTTNITEETTISVKAHKYGTISATLNIDDPANMNVYRGYSYNGELISGLVSGQNTIEVSETNTTISIVPQSGCYITSVTDNEGQSYYADYNGSYTVTLKDGMTVNIVSGAISRDSKAIVYIDNRSAAAQYFSFTRNDHSEVDLKSGYNTVEFYSGDNPMGLSWYGAPYANVFLNGETVAPMYEGSTSYQISVENGDVLKIYLASNPKTYGVTFSMDDKINAGEISVKRDIMTTVADWAGGFSVLQGTQIDIAAENVSVTVNNETVVPVDGIFTFVVSDNTNVSIAIPTAINDTKAADNNGRHYVYNMQGMKILDNADAINSLPAGVYIINGKKVVVRK